MSTLQLPNCPMSVADPVSGVHPTSGLSGPNHAADEVLGMLQNSPGVVRVRLSEN